jgi:hypothetical protein
MSGVGSCLGRHHSIPSASVSSPTTTHVLTHARKGPPSQAQALAAPSDTWNIEEMCA